MTDPLDSIGQEAEAGVAIGPEGEPDSEMQGPQWQDRVIELFKPCPEDPMSKKGIVSNFVNSALAKRSGVPVEQIHVGENVSHCIDHLLPGVGMAGMPPILGLVKSYVDYRGLANKHPDNGKLVRP